MSSVETPNSAAAAVFAALGNSTRLELVARLSDGEEHSISALTKGNDLTRQATTKHLVVLQEAGLLDCRRVGRESRFTIRPGSINQARDYLARASEQWDSAIERLQAVVGQEIVGKE